MAQEEVECRCSACDAHLFRCMNAWSQTSNNAFCAMASDQPANFPGSAFWEAPSSQVNSKIAELEDCEIRSLHCNNCRGLVALRCTNAPERKWRNKGKCFFKLAKITQISVATGLGVGANLVPKGTMLGRESGENGLALMGQAASATPVPQVNGTSQQNAEVTRLQNELVRAMDLIEKQRGDFERSLNSIDGLKAGLSTCQEFVGKAEDNPFLVRDELADTTLMKSLLTEIKRLSDRIDQLEMANEATQKYIDTKQRTGKMTGPLARQMPMNPMPMQASLPNSTAPPGRPMLIAAGPPPGPGPNMVMGDPAQRPFQGDPAQRSFQGDPAQRPFQGDPAQRQYQVPFNRGDFRGDYRGPPPQLASQRPLTESSPSTFVGSNPTTVASSAPDEARDRYMGPPAAENRPLVVATNGPQRSISAVSTGGMDHETQAYLERTVKQDNEKDVDYEPSTRGQSPKSRGYFDEPSNPDDGDKFLEPLTPERVRTLKDSMAGPPPRGSGRGGRPRGSGRGRGRGVYAGTYRKSMGSPRTPASEESFRLGSKETSSARGPFGRPRAMSSGSKPAQGLKRQGSILEKSPSTSGKKKKRLRDEEGYLLRADGQRDLRSIPHSRKRDEEGFLLRSDGKRDMRSVRLRKSVDGGGNASSTRSPSSSPEVSSAATSPDRPVGMGSDKHRELMSKIFPERRRQSASK